jgi:hypothetical protein
VIRAWSALATGALVALTASPAPADDTKKVCTEAYDQGQSLRDAHKLRQAREQLRVCSQPACATFIVKDCEAWLEAVERSLPTLVFSAKDPAGRDLLDVRVTIDGQPLVSALDGQAVPVDPGPHTFRFEQADGTSATQQVLVKEGAKNVDVSVLLSRADAPAPRDAPRTSPQPLPPSSSPRQAAASRPPESHARTTVGLVVGGVGLAGLATGTVTGLLAMSSWNTAKNECPTYTNCSQQAIHDQTQTKGLGTVSTVGFIAGGVFTAVGAILVLTAPASDGTRVGVSLSPAGLIATGEF